MNGIDILIDKDVPDDKLKASFCKVCNLEPDQVAIPHDYAGYADVSPDVLLTCMAVRYRKSKRRRFRVLLSLDYFRDDLPDFNLLVAKEISDSHECVCFLSDYEGDENPLDPFGGLIVMPGNIMFPGQEDSTLDDETTYGYALDEQTIAQIEMHKKGKKFGEGSLYLSSNSGANKRQKKNKVRPPPKLKRTVFAVSSFGLFPATLLRFRLLAILANFHCILRQKEL